MKWQRLGIEDKLLTQHGSAGRFKFVSVGTIQVWNGLSSLGNKRTSSSLGLIAPYRTPLI